MSLYKGSQKIAGLIRGEDISHATETHAGIIEIATQGEVLGGASDTKAVTPTKLKQYYYDKTSANVLLAGKQDTISDLETIRSDSQLGKDASDTISTYGDIVTHNANEFQETGDYATNTALSQGLATKQNIISDLEIIRSNAQDGKNIIPQVNTNTQRIEDLTTSRIPDVIYYGTPKITGGQVSNFSTTNYLQFPFIDISRGLPFDIYFSFTTDDDVTTQQNILDSHFGLALAIQNGKGVMALSSNGTNWDIGSITGVNTILPNTTYFVKYSWTGAQYNASLSTNDQTYVPDMILNSDKSPYKTTIYIGGSEGLFGVGTAHPFKGIINFIKSKVVVNGTTVWEGMADVGLASRANVSLNNLDDVGEARFNAKQDLLTPANAGSNITISTGSNIPIFDLPEKYQQLSFIGSTGSQWIDTGIAVNTLANPRIVTEFSMNQKSDVDWFGTISTATPTILYNFSNGVSTPYIRWGSTSTRAIQLNTGHSYGELDFYNTFKKLDIKEDKIYVNDSHIGTFYGTGSFTNNQSLLIFRGRSLSQSSYRYFQIYDGEELRACLVACYDTENGLYGMYDTVSNTFKANAGTGTFIGGDPVGSFLKISAAVPTKTSELTNDSNFVKNTDYATTNIAGVVKTASVYGTRMYNEGIIGLFPASLADLNVRSSGNQVAITSANLDLAVKQAMCDGRGSSWTDTEKANARDRMGVTSELSTKQNTLTAGENITIENNVISASGTPVEDFTDQEIEEIWESING